MSHQIGDTDSAYLAGFIDADGSFGIYLYKNPHNGISYYKPRVTAVNNDIETLEYLQSIWGGSLTVNSNGSKNNGGLVWVSLESIIEIICDIRPYLLVKSKQAELMLEWCESRQSTRSHRTAYTDREIEIVGQIKALKGKINAIKNTKICC